MANIVKGKEITMKTRVKLFYNDGYERIDDRINEFLEDNYYELVDIKLTNVDNTIATQTDMIVMLVYRETATSILEKKYKEIGDNARRDKV